MCLYVYLTYCFQADVIRIYAKGNEGLLPRCHVTGMSTPSAAMDQPQQLTVTVVIAFYSTFYTYPASHHIMRAACSHPSMRSLQRERRQPPVNHQMRDAYAVVTQTDLFHLIDNVTGDGNEYSHMCLFQFHLQAYEIETFAEHFSFSTIHPTDQWALDSQRNFLRNNLKYLHDPRVLYAYDKENHQQYQVMRADFDGTWSKCMEKLREGKWSMPWGRMEIDSTNYEAFLKDYSRVEDSNKVNQNALEIDFRRSDERIEQWQKVMEFERNADDKESKTVATEVSSQDF